MRSGEHVERTPEERRELALSLAQVVNSWHRGEPEESAEPAAPIHLNDKQLEIIKEWAADDRLWTTQETVEFNLEVFARAIIAAIPKRPAPSPDPPPNGEVLDGLRYIADSPAHEHGGFHPEAVKTAKNAILEVERLREALREAQNVFKIDRAHEMSGPIPECDCPSCHLHNEYRFAANKLIDYIEAHDWGTIPEPYDSINPLLKLLGRAALAPSLPTKALGDLGQKEEL